MSRPSDWSPLHDGDPIPGDPGTIRNGIDAFGRTDLGIRAAAGNLDVMVSHVTMSSDAVAAFAKQAAKVAYDLRLVGDRYDRAANALSSYVSALDTAQNESLNLLNQAQRAEYDRQSALTQMHHAQHQADTARDPATHTLALAQVNTQRKHANGHAAEISKYQNQLKAVIASRDAAANAAAAGIADADDANSHLADTRTDRFKELTNEVAGGIAGWTQVLADALSTVSTYVLVAAVAAAMIPGLEELAPVLFAASRLLTALSVAAGAVVLTAKVLQLATGHGSVKEVLGDAALLGLTLFVPKAIGVAGNKMTNLALRNPMLKAMTRQKLGQTWGGVATQGKSLTDRMQYKATGRYSYPGQKLVKTIDALHDKLTPRWYARLDKWESRNSYVMFNPGGRGDIGPEARVIAGGGLLGAQLASDGAKKVLDGESLPATAPLKLTPWDAAQIVRASLYPLPMYTAPDASHRAQAAAAGTVLGAHA